MPAMMPTVMPAVMPAKMPAMKWPIVSIVVSALGWAAPATAQGCYALEVLARTGSSIQRIDREVSINSEGVVAFAGRDSNNLSQVFVAQRPGGASTLVNNASSRAVYQGTSISDAVPWAVAYRRRVSGSPPVWTIQRQAWALAPVTIGRSGAGRDFDSASFRLHVNRVGQVGFSGLVQGSTRTALFRGAVAPPTSLNASSGTTSFQPQISDAGAVLIRNGAGRAVLWKGPGQVETIAGTGWTNLGAAPGLSADGRAVAFIGNRGQQDGLFLSVQATTGRRIVKLAGEGASPFTSFDGAQRVGVISDGDPGTEQRLTVLFAAKRTVQSTTKTGVNALDVSLRRDGTGQWSEAVGRPIPVVELGGDLAGRKVTAFWLHHPLAASGKVAFWVQLDDNSVAVVRSVARVVTELPGTRRLMWAHNCAAQAVGASAMNVTIDLDNDNGDSALQTKAAYRRWWHFELQGLPSSTATTVNVELRDFGFGGKIRPVWGMSSDGGKIWTADARVPAGALSNYRVVGAGGGTFVHKFVVTVPAGSTNLRLAKFFPYTLEQHERFLARIASSPYLRGGVRSLGESEEKRRIAFLEITDPATSDDGKVRVWIHAGVHPAETTSYFTAEGLIDFLLSNDLRASLLRQKIVFDVVPLANPDGLVHGNYRTNIKSKNLESQWCAAVPNMAKEAGLLKRAIEQRMGSVTNPAKTPIVALLNIHSSHLNRPPFMWRHRLNPNAGGRGCGTTNAWGIRAPTLALEQRWIRDLRAASAFVRRGGASGWSVDSKGSSPSRSVVEGWIHDHYSLKPAWEEVMAITFEGTYFDGPTAGVPGVPGDYRRLGTDVGVACSRFFGRSLRAYGAICGRAVLTGSILSGPDRLKLTLSGAAPLSNAALLFGTRRVTPGVPLPWAPFCRLQTGGIAFAFGGRADANGTMAIPLMGLPPIVCVNMQAVTLDPSTSRARVSNGLGLLFWK